MRVNLLVSKKVDFSIVKYHRNKMDYESGELMLVKNFPDAIQASKDPRQIRQYLKEISQKSRSKQPQFHAVISSRFQELSKIVLCDLAKALMVEHGYGKQPFIVIFHNDTEHNHVHIVSTRISVDTGLKKSCYYEYITIGQSFNQAVKIVTGQDYELDARKLLDFRYTCIEELKMLFTANYFKMYFNKKSGEYVVSRNLAKVLGILQDQLKWTARVNMDRLQEIERLYKAEKAHASSLVFGVAETRKYFHSYTSEPAQKELSKAATVYLSELQYRMKTLHGFELILKLDNNLQLVGTLIDTETCSIFGPQYTGELLKNFEWTNTFLQRRNFISLNTYNIQGEKEKELLKLLNPAIDLKDYMLFKNLEKQATRSRAEIKSDVAFFINNPLKQGIRVLRNPNDQIYYAAHERCHHLEPLQTLVGAQLFQKYLSMEQKIVSQSQSEDLILESTLKAEERGGDHSILDVLEDLLIPTFVSATDREEQNKKRKKKIR